MLDLQAGVHLDEEELAVFPEEFDGADAEVADLRRWPRLTSRRWRRGSADRAGEGASSSTFWWRRCSEQSRSPRWTTLPWLSAMTWKLDVARLLEVALHIDRAVAEGGQGLGLGRLDGLDEVLLGQGDLHAAPAAAGGGLDDHREADGLGAAMASSMVSTSPSEPGTTGMPAS
jgi:hypothetical protein